MLAFNILTLYISDDFRYLYSFYDYSRIESLSQIILSMRAHRYTMNGRLVVHTLVQIFGMLPMWLFDVVNSGMFVLQLMLLNKLAKGQYPHRNIIILAGFGGLWFFCPVFGQVNLWQDGAVNYLWGTVFALLFLLPYVEDFLYHKKIRTGFGKFCFLCLSFGMGAYSETASAAAIFMAGVLLGLTAFYRKQKPDRLMLVSIAITFVGYVSIYLAPAQWRQKSAQMTIPTLLENVVNIAVEYWLTAGILLLVFLLALMLNLLLHTDRKQLLLALVFFAGSLAAHFILIFAQYYVPRSSSAAVVYLLASDMILLYPLLEKNSYKRCVSIVLAGFLILLIPSVAYGSWDIYDTYIRMKANEEYIYQCKEQGMMDIQVPIITCKTEHAVANGGRYLKEDPTTWPNEAMAVYYEVNSLTGVYVD